MLRDRIRPSRPDLRRRRGHDLRNLSQTAGPPGTDADGTAQLERQVRPIDVDIRIVDVWCGRKDVDNPPVDNS